MNKEQSSRLDKEIWDLLCVPNMHKQRQGFHALFSVYEREAVEQFIQWYNGYVQDAYSHIHNADPAIHEYLEALCSQVALKPGDVIHIKPGQKEYAVVTHVDKHGILTVTEATSTTTEEAE